MLAQADSAQSSFASSAPGASQGCPSVDRNREQPVATFTDARATAWRGAFRDLPREHPFEPLSVTGSIPSELRGTLYRSGPSLFSAQGQSYRHWFDGDGAVSAVRFANGEAAGAVRLVPSEGLLAERRAKKRIYAGYAMPSNVPWFRRLGVARVKNTGNTSVILWQQRLYALMEACRPTELDPDTLATLGERDLDGVVVKTFSAHPHRVPQRRASYNFGARFNRPAKLDVYELPDVGSARRLTTMSIPPSFVHDFIATERHLIFFVPPLRLRLLPMFFGLGSFSEHLHWKPEAGTEIIVVPIDEPRKATRFTVEPFYQWHFVNAFERGREIIVDYVRYPDFESNAVMADILSHEPNKPFDSAYHRAVINPIAKTFTSEPRWDVMCDFPRIASSAIAREHRFAYLANYSRLGVRGNFDELSKLDLQTGKATRIVLGAGRYPSEPVFVRRKDGRAEDDGYILSLVYDARADRSSVIVLDARRLETGPVAEVWFDHHIPFTFHGNWVPA
jgi:all-trans-8'-apo-beta-carotenal 15,15'-oxygenase